MQVRLAYQAYRDRKDLPAQLDCLALKAKLALRGHLD